MQVRLRDLDVVAEDAIEADLQRLDAGARALAVFHLGDDLLARAADVPQVVDFRVEAVAHEAAVARQRRRLVGDRLIDPLRAGPADRRARRSGCAAAAPGTRSAAAPSRGTAASDRDSAIRSRGPAVESAMRAISRSRSWIDFSVSRALPRSVVLTASSSTASRRSRIGSSAVSGRSSQVRSRRQPIGVTVRSISSSSDPRAAAVDRLARSRGA